MLCSAIEHGMTSLSFQIVLQKDDEKLGSFAQFENEMVSYRAVIEQSTTSYV